jgi:hypothetical protein
LILLASCSNNSNEYTIKAENNNNDSNLIYKIYDNNHECIGEVTAEKLDSVIIDNNK